MHLLLERVSRLAQVQVYLDDKVDTEVTAHLEEVPLAQSSFSIKAVLSPESAAV